MQFAGPIPKVLCFFWQCSGKRPLGLLTHAVCNLDDSTILQYACLPSSPPFPLHAPCRRGWPRNCIPSSSNGPVDIMSLFWLDCQIVGRKKHSSHPKVTDPPPTMQQCASSRQKSEWSPWDCCSRPHQRLKIAIENSYIWGGGKTLMHKHT